LRECRFENELATFNQMASRPELGFMVTGYWRVTGCGNRIFSDWLKERRKTRRERHGAINRTQLALIGQLNTIDNVLEQYWNPSARTNERIPFDSFYDGNASLRVAYDSIAFLLPQLTLTCSFKSKLRTILSYSNELPDARMKR